MFAYKLNFFPNFKVLYVVTQPNILEWKVQYKHLIIHMRILCTHIHLYFIYMVIYNSN